MLEQLDGTWFKPLVQRLAENEPVPIEEIAAVYHKQHDRPLESKAIATRFFPSEQRGYDWSVANPPLQRCLIDLISSATCLAETDWLEWQRSTSRFAHRYIAVHYLDGQPAPTMHPANVFRALTLSCVQAARAAEREGVSTPAARLAALKAPGVFAGGHSSYQTLFPNLT